MSAASVLRSFNTSVMPGPVMPMDVAMRFYISHSPPPLHGFLSSYEELQRANNRVNQSKTTTGGGRCCSQKIYKPLRPCLSSQQKAGEDDNSIAWNNKSGKKRVVFADSKGMSLTAIHVFNKFDEEPYQRRTKNGGVEELQFDMSDLETAAMDLKISTTSDLALDFKPPSSDYLDFRNRLIQNSVCLENCSLQNRTLTGTVKVRNIGFEKSVHVRATFDSWTSFTDVNCTFMNNVYGCHDTDTFAFVLELPAHIAPQYRVEFCVCFKAQTQTFWDNNDGKNYVLKHVGLNGQALKNLSTQASVGQKKREDVGMKVVEVEFDQFGSPRMCSGLFPGWQSWGQYDTTVPYW